jgi:hypothetical protein
MKFIYTKKDMTFKATLDKTSKLLTIGITLLSIGIIIGSRLADKDEKSEGSLILIALLLLPYGITYAFSPLSYELNEKSLIINRPIKNVTLNYSQIKSISKLENGKLSWSIRTFGVGGLFGYFGKFWNKEFGSMTWYTTRRDKVIMIITNENKRIIITPDDSEKFINEFSKIEYS